MGGVGTADRLPELPGASGVQCRCRRDPTGVSSRVVWVLTGGPSDVPVPPGADAVLVRYGELGTGGPGCADEWRLASSRTPLLAGRAAAGAFGVVSTSPARAVAADLGAVEDVLAVAAPVYDGSTFAVRARRATDVTGLTSHDVEEVGGAAV